MKAAFGKMDITPPPDMLGAYRRSPGRKAKGTHDPLLARWAILEADGFCWCLLGLDVMSLLTDQAYRWRCAIGHCLGIAPENVSIAATHTHNAMDLNSANGDYDHNWEVALLHELVDHIRASTDRMTAVTCRWEHGEYPHAINRHNSDWGKTTHTDPIDPAVSVAKFISREDAEKCHGYLVHYTAHPTAAMNVDFLYSGDYPGQLLEKLDKEWGATGIFLQGAAGNVNLEVGERSYAHVEKHAAALAEVIRTARPCSISGGGNSLSAKTVEWSVNIRNDLPAPDEVRKEIAECLAEPDGENLHWNRLRGLRTLEHAHVLHPGFSRFWAQQVTLAGRTLLFLPGEWFVQFGLGLKEARPELNPLWVGYSNGHLGYLPRSEDYDEGYMASPLANFLKKGESERIYEKILQWLE